VGPTYRPGLHGGFAESHAFDLHVAVPAQVGEEVVRG
jgi:hypothetical protein